MFEQSGVTVWILLEGWIGLYFIAPPDWGTVFILQPYRTELFFDNECWLFCLYSISLTVWCFIDVKNIMYLLFYQITWLYVFKLTQILRSSDHFQWCNQMELLWCMFIHLINVCTPKCCHLINMPSGEKVQSCCFFIFIYNIPEEKRLKNYMFFEKLQQPTVLR